MGSLLERERLPLGRGSRVLRLIESSARLARMD
jgi:hypothetical protein